MLEYVMQQRKELIAKLAAMEREAMQYRGALAALDDVLEHAQQIAKGGSGVAAPIPFPTAPSPTPGSAAVLKALKVGHGPLQADTELRE